MSKVIYKYDPETPGDHWPGIPARDLTEEDMHSIEDADLVRSLVEKKVTYRDLTSEESAEQDKAGVEEQPQEVPQTAPVAKVKKVDDAVSTATVNTAPTATSAPAGE